MKRPGTSGPVSNAGRTIAVLAAIAALGSMAIHMIAPALPLLAEDLGASPRAAQSVISFYLFGLGFGQLLAGPMADRFGRRPILLIGLALYTAGGLLGALAADAEALVAARVIQGCGASAGLVTSRAIVGDLFGAEEAGKRQATLMGVVLISPAIAPVIGGLIADFTGWRVILALLAAVGLAAFLVSFRFLPESLRPTGSSGNREGVSRKYLRVLRNRSFLRVAAAIAGMSSALYMFLGGAPFLLSGAGLSTGEAGLCFMLVAGSSIAGTTMVGRLERRTNAMRVGLALSAAGSLLMLALALASPLWLPVLISPILLVGLGAGIAVPAGMAAAIHSEEGLSGTAASLAGSLQMVGGGASFALLGLFGPPSPVVLACGLASASLFALLACPAKLPASPVELSGQARVATAERQ
jgi:MFS transporter, DHA1 family, multidrug resistance protein